MCTVVGLTGKHGVSCDVWRFSNDLIKTLTIVSILWLNVGLTVCRVLEDIIEDWDSGCRHDLRTEPRPVIIEQKHIGNRILNKVIRI
jgi:hypothetical protein